MATKERAADRGTRTGIRAASVIGGEIRMARSAAGLTLADVGRAVGMSYSQVGRIERAVHPSVTVVQLARVCSVVGLDLHLRAYPGGRPLRDIAHIALLQRLRGRLHPDLILRVEVPLSVEGDRRAWDAMITNRGGTRDETRGETRREARSTSRIAVEAETRITDFQALARRIALKQRDDGIEVVVLVVAGTRANRNAVKAAGPFIAESYAVDTRATLAKLAAGRLPQRSALVIL